LAGCILTGIFADNAVATMSGDEQIKGGWINGKSPTVGDCNQKFLIAIAKLESLNEQREKRSNDVLKFVGN
jgi:hypothetical protein